MILWMLGASILLIHAEPVATSEQLLASYPPLPDGRACQSVAVPVNRDALLVTVVTPGANPLNPSLRMGNRSVPIRLIGHDPVTRLGFFQANGMASPRSAEWLDDSRGSVGTGLRAMTPEGPVKCLATGWVKQIGGKVLPLALLRVNFDRAVPAAGTPLTEPGGRVAAIVFQSTGSGNTGYAIPAEAMHRVRRDLCNGGRLIRGWLGLTLHSESQSPRIVRVLPNSPAAEAGILPGDVLLGVGSRQISDYADAANAFFYLVPGEPTHLKLLRGGKPLAFTLTPTRPQAE
jgi:hypothetical protein